MCANRELQDNISERIVRQYLISKNFTNVLDAFEMEARKHKSSSCYHPTDILEVLRTSLKESNLEQLADMWSTLENTYFVRLDSDRQRDARDLKVYFFKTFITQAVMNKRERKVREFFENLSSYFTVDSDDWRSWYALPYITDPANHPDYCMFFTKTWIDILFLSMNNFLCIVFHEDLFQNNLLRRMEILESRLSENQFSQVMTSGQPPFGKLLDDCNELGLIRPGNRRQE
ncbi:hypothetical protein FBUS_00913 [Fasciolopsis buskii]|uniref:ARMC9 CTLH-like domain-containing protein n=1 Tax=Fasciolopsis buskii TaxID=27845 RepID=A0A8E0S2I2_9TREM|nr:hypothetical protein FBUS_00913 [Fasciolopsis buski]